MLAVSFATVGQKKKLFFIKISFNPLQTDNILISRFTRIPPLMRSFLYLFFFFMRGTTVLATYPAYKSPTFILSLLFYLIHHLTKITYNEKIRESLLRGRRLKFL